MSRLCALTLCALVAGVVAGCGGGGPSSSTSTTSSAVTQTLGTTTAASTSTSSSPTTTSSTTSRTTTTTSTRSTHSRSRTTTTPVGPTHAQLRMALCVRNVAQQSSVLTAAERSLLDSMCRRAWTGHLTPAAFAVAHRRLCVTMVADSGLVGAAATAAEQTCEQRGG